MIVCSYIPSSSGMSWRLLSCRELKISGTVQNDNSAYGEGDSDSTADMMVDQHGSFMDAGQDQNLEDDMPASWFQL